MTKGFWFIPIALAVLGRVRCRKPRPFTAAELLEWAPELRTPRTARTACETMQRGGLLTAAPAPATPGVRRPTNPVMLWSLTADGVTACKAAQQEQASQAHSAAAKVHNAQRVHPGALRNRAWALLRIRRTLTAQDAASVLADAGDDVARMERAIGKYLIQWEQARPDAIEVSARRINRFKRYVLVKDIGNLPPKHVVGGAA